MASDKVNSVELGVGPSSVTVKATGGGAGRLTVALYDLVSPFTNGMGWLGDQVQVARSAAAIRAASKASEKLRSEGITSGNIPPKLLLPWLEAASLESELDDNLTDAWAGLFVRAVKCADAAVASYIDTLKKLGKEEAGLLQFFATDTSPSYSRKFYERDKTGIFSESNPLRGKYLHKIDDLLKRGDAAELRRYMEHCGIQGMCQVIFYSDWTGRRSTEYFDKHEHAISNLEHLGLIDVFSKTLNTQSSSMDITWFQITKYAFDLVYACEGITTGELSRRRVDTKEATNA